jgi:hypothetical protein
LHEQGILIAEVIQYGETADLVEGRRGEREKFFKSHQVGDVVLWLSHRLGTAVKVKYGIFISEL